MFIYKDNYLIRYILPLESSVRYCIGRKFGELTLFEHLAKESLAN